MDFALVSDPKGNARTKERLRQKLTNPPNRQPAQSFIYLRLIPSCSIVEAKGPFPVTIFTGKGHFILGDNLAFEWRPQILEGHQPEWKEGEILERVCCGLSDGNEAAIEFFVREGRVDWRQVLPSHFQNLISDQAAH